VSGPDFSRADEVLSLCHPDRPRTSAVRRAGVEGSRCGRLCPCPVREFFQNNFTCPCKMHLSFQTPSLSICHPESRAPGSDPEQFPRIVSTGSVPADTLARVRDRLRCSHAWPTKWFTAVPRHFFLDHAASGSSLVNKCAICVQIFNYSITKSENLPFPPLAVLRVSAPPR